MMEGYITAFDELDRIHGYATCVEDLARILGVRLGDVAEPIRQIRYAAGYFQPIKASDRDMILSAFDFLYLAWLEFS